MKNGPGAMNRVYRLVWNDRTEAYVAVAESARPRGKRSSGVAGALVMAGLLTGLLAGGAAHAAGPPAPQALPSGGNVVAGQASLNQAGSRLDIQQDSARAAINWQRFDIGSQAQVNVQQPGASAVLLNRVVGADPSAIFGRLNANGQVLLVNPNGIVFGKGAQVDVGSLVASTLDITDSDFMTGHLKFTRNGATGSVLNLGSLKAATGGHVALLAPEVINEGVVSARLGTAVLAAGEAITLDVNGSQLLGVKVEPSQIASLVENRQLVQAEGGRVILSAGAAQRLREQAVAGAAGATNLVEQDGTLRLVSAGGRIEAQGGQVDLSGSLVDVSGTVQAGGGRIGVQADYLGQGGTLDVSAAAGRGGRIDIRTGTAVQTAQAVLAADGRSGGGSIRLDGDAAQGVVYSSAQFSAQGLGAGAKGGEIAVSADSVQLRAASLDASGQAGGGRVRVGGGFQGRDGDIANAQNVGINASTVLRADATERGDGGQVVVWSDDKTFYAGRLSARGGSSGGHGGQAEVSGKGALSFVGSADLAAPRGRAGQLLLDPRNILIDNTGNSLAALNLDDPTPANNNGFGTVTQVLGNGNVIITAPNASTGGLSGTGAVYLYNSSTGALLANLRGSQAGDHAGNAGVKVLGNGNYLVLSPDHASVSGVNAFDLSTNDASSPTSGGAYALKQNVTAAAGAITWQSGNGSGSSLISSGNSLVGSTANTDSETRYTYTGASTVVDQGATTVTADDRLGRVTTFDVYGGVVAAGTTTITELADGNVAIAAPNWNNGRGAVAWMNGSTGALANAAAGGTLSSSVALVGSTPIRSMAPVVTDTSSKKVYVLGVDQSLAFTNIYNGSSVRNAPPGGGGDALGQALTALPDGSYVVASPLWTNGAATYAGAVTHGAAGGSTGTVGSANSLVGSHSFDFVGSGDVSKVGATGANYVVASPYWSDSANPASGRYLENNPNGAVTWVDGSSGQVFGTGSTGAVVGAGNSLVGGAGDAVGALDGLGNSPYTSYDYSTMSGLSTSTSTRLQGSNGGVKVLQNGNYLVVANAWTSRSGAVSFGTGAAGLAGTVSASNSLVGTTVGDKVGQGVEELSGSNYVVLSPQSDLGAVDGGAVTWGSGTTGISGAVSTSNSLYGTHASDAVGSGGVRAVGALDGQGLRPNYIVLSPHWGNRSGATSTVSYGAVSWVDGSTGQLWGGGGVGGAVAAGNSLVGSGAGDYVGSIHTADSRPSVSIGDGSNLHNILGDWNAELTRSVDVLANGDYLVRSPNWGGGKGAISWGAGASGTGGAVSAANSLVGSIADVVVTSSTSQTRAGFIFTDTTYHLTTTGDHVGLVGQKLSNGNYIAISPYWNNGRGAITWVGSGNRTGVIGSANSLVGSTPDVYSDANQSALVSSGDRLGTLANTRWTVPVISDTVVSGQTRSTASTRPVGPYGFATVSNVNTFTGYVGGSNVFVGTAYSVVGARDAGIVDEWGYISTNFIDNGYPLVKELSGGNVLVASPNWNNGAATRAGAVTWINGATGALADASAGGTLSATNSLVGSHSNDVLGFRLPLDGMAQLGNGNFLLVNPQWNEERGAVTWGSAGAGVTGTVGAANSLVGDRASGGLGFTATNGYVYRIVGGSSLSSDWVDRSSDLAGDRVGIGGVTVLADGNAVIGSPLWNQSAPWTQMAPPTSLGAATWINGSTGQLRDGSAGGSISATNSLVGSQFGDAVSYSAWVDPGSGVHYVAPGVSALAGGRYAVASPWWSNGSRVGVGAVTFASAGGLAGEVSAANSLIGATAGDHVGRSLSSFDWYSYGAQIDRGVQVIDTGSAVNYLVRSQDWTNTYDFATGGAGAGAVTWVDGATGRAYGESGVGATVSVANSLVGNVAGDGVGSQMRPLTRQVNGQSVATGDMLLLSSLAYCGVPNVGSITLVSGAAGAAGPIGWRNSIIGLASAADGLDTSVFDGYSYYSDVRSTLLPAAVTGSEQVAWRPLVWVNPNTTSGFNASRALALTLLADNTGTPTSVDQVNGVGGNANWGGSLYAGNGSGFNAVGGNTGTGLLGFSASPGSDVVITPATLTALLNAGTDVTLQASNDITVLRDISVSAGGNGGNLTLEAGRSVHLRANIDTDNGRFTAIANQAASAGVLDADCSTCTAVISQAVGTSINAGTSDVSLQLLKSTDKTNNDAGTVRLSSLYGDVVQVHNAGLSASSAGRGIRFNGGASIGDGDTTRIELAMGGNTAGGGALVLGADTQLRSTDLISVAAADPANGLALAAASGAGLAMTASEMGAVIQHSSADQAGATVVNALDFTQAPMLRGSATLAADLHLVGGSGGLQVAGMLKSGAASGHALALSTVNGTVALGAASAVSGGAGELQFDSTGGSVTQSAGSTVTASRVSFSGDGTATLTAGTNTIGSLDGSFGSASIKTAGGVAVGSAGLALNSGLVLQASGASADLTLDGVVSTGSGSIVLAAGRNFVNNNALDTGIAAGSGRYLVYSADPTASTEGMSSYSKHYAQSYSAGSTPAYASSGNWFLYSVAPTLTVSAGGGSTVTYGTSASTPSVSISGYIDGDTLANATSGSLDTSLSSFTPSGAGYTPAGSYTLTLNGQGSFSSPVGYTISVTPGSGTLTVQPKAINASGLSADSKVYDGTTTTTVSGSASLLGGGSTSGDGRYLSGDSVNISGTASGSFADRHAGTGKNVTLGGLSLSGADSGNYTISAGSVTADITPKTLTLTGLSAAASKVYDGSLAATVSGTAALLTAQAAGSGSSSDGQPYSVDTLTLSGTASGTYNAASVAGASSVSFGGITLGGADAGNYVLNAGSQAATITPKALTLSGLSVQGKVYDGQATATLIGTATLSGGDFVGGDMLGLSGTPTASFVDANAGTGKTVTASGLVLTGPAAGNYALTPFSALVDISPRSLDVSANNLSKTYGDADPALTFRVGGQGFAGADNVASVFSGALSAPTGSAATAGTHAIVQGSLAVSNGNYQLAAYNPGTLTVAKASLTVTANDAQKTYGGADPTLGYSVNTAQLKYGDAASVVSGVNLSTATGAAATAGTHAIVASGAVASNYQLALVDGTLSVAKANLTVTVNDAQKTYGDADPTLGYSVNTAQLQYADTAAVLNGINLSTATGAAATAGTHAIVASGGSVGNYNLAFNGGTLSVAKANLTVTANDAQKTYGDADPTLGYTANAAQLKYGDTALVVSGLNLATATGAAATAGTHAIVASGGSASNYNLALNNGTLTVARAPLTVTADSKARSSGEADPVLTYQVNASQLRHGDSADVVTQVRLTAPGGAALPPGSYAIVASDGQADNYALHYVDGVLVVAPSPSLKAENLVTQAMQTAPPPMELPKAAAPGSGLGLPGSLTVLDGGLAIVPATATQPGTGAGIASGGVGAAQSGTAAGGAPAGADTDAGTGGGAGGATGTGPAAAVGGNPSPAGAGSGASGAAAGDAAPGAGRGAGSGGAGGNAAASNDSARLMTARPTTLLKLEPGKELSLDTSASFQRPDDARLTYAAVLEDGSPLPGWLQLDARSGVLSGQPPAGQTRGLRVKVTATMESGSSASAEVVLEAANGQ